MTENAFARRLLRHAVETPSPSGHEDQVVEVLLRALDGRTDRAWRDHGGNLVAQVGRGACHVIVLGHLDTVPGVVPVEERDGALYGRGSVDAKGPLCAALAALTRLDDATRDALRVTVVGAVGEEAPGSVGARHAAATLPTPDLLIIAEPSGWDAVTLGYKGVFRSRLEAHRPSQHSAGPHPSASDDLLAALRAIDDAVAVEGAQTRDAEAEEPRLFDTLQRSVLHLEHRHDGLAEHAAAELQFRLPPAWPPSRVRSLLDSANVPAGVVRIDADEAFAAVRSPADGALQRAFRTAIRTQGGRPRRLVKTGTSDWNVVADIWSVPTLAYGPGDSALDHAPNEHLDLRAYDASVEVLNHVFKRLGEAQVLQTPESS